MMELQFQSLSIKPNGSNYDLELLEALRNGSKLSEDQLEQLLKLLMLRMIQNEIIDIFNSSTREFLRAIHETSITNTNHSIGDETPLKSTDSQYSFSQIATILSCLVSQENYEAVMSICEPELNSNPSTYLCIYTDTAMKYCENFSTVIDTVAPLLGSSSKDVVMAVTLTIYYYAKKFPACEGQLARKMKSVLNEDTSEVTKEEFQFLFTAFEVLFPIIPQSLVPLYCSESCKNLFLFRGMILDPDTYPDDIPTAEQLLRVISVSCMYEDARKFSSANYAQFLISGNRVNSSNTIVCLSCLCLVKLWDFTSLEKKISVQSILMQVTLQIMKTQLNDPNLDPLVESLTYLTLGATLKAIVRSDTDLVKRLLSILKDTDNNVLRFGVLTIFSNMTKLSPPGASKDDQTRSYLKSVADTQKTGERQEEEANILSFNKRLVSLKFLSEYTKNCLLTDKNRSTIVTIIYFLTISQKSDTLQKLGEQGAPDILLKYVLDHSTLDKETGKTKSNSDKIAIKETRSYAIKAMAAISRSTKPDLLFKEFKLPIVVPFLVEMLDQNAKEGVLEQEELVLYNALDLLFCLFALTNICAFPDSVLHKIVIQKTFDNYLNDLIFNGSKPDIQKAAWELVNNLIDNPFMLAKFFNSTSPSSKKNLSLLIKFLNSENYSLQEIIAGLLANATSEYALVAESIVGDQKLFEELAGIIVQIFNEQNLQLGILNRVGVFLFNLTQFDISATVLGMNLELKKSILKAIKDCADDDVKSILAEVFRALYKK